MPKTPHITSPEFVADKHLVCNRVRNFAKHLVEQSYATDDKEVIMLFEKEDACLLAAQLFQLLRTIEDTETN